MITEIKEGTLSLEDYKGTILLNLTAAQPTAGMFVENAIVLAQGQLEAGQFVVTGLGLPPPEERQATLAAHSGERTRVCSARVSHVQRHRFLWREAEQTHA
jgi:hypothetical protein